MTQGAEEPPDGGAPLTLSSGERAVLSALRSLTAAAIEEEELAESLALSKESVRGSLQRLKSKRLAVVDEESIPERSLTARGVAALSSGLPERRLLRAVESAGGTLAASELEGEAWSGEERSAAIGILRRLGYLAEGLPFRFLPTAPAVSERLPAERALEGVGHGEVPDPKEFDSLKKRGLVKLENRRLKRWSASSEGRELPLATEGAESLGALTAELLRTGGWRTASFRPYDVRAAVPFLSGARPHPYRAWLREFEEILVGLGFEQAEGPLLETEFWNSDALFMPQEHPARSIHDVLSVSGVTAHPPPEGLLERVRAAHEGRALPGETEPISPGWGSPYDVEVARRPVLRSQTTAVSARFLAKRPKAPFRMYCLDRNFRRDAVDATHGVEFGQCEGVLGQEGTTIRELIGMFRALAEAIGIRELKIRPSYFPFTEPSIEGYVRHPRLGWIEVFPGGLFRPEVLRPLGVDVPVAAWGIGVTRLAMLALGANDLRELYTDDLGRLAGARE
ncbi:MAG: phenylalanine--tRNA ligase subunit alpha [Thermoplasmata archaeon]|nr:phenylalanine--tRNA ligase subunit alpha [Thermoplasmata archaeon]